MADNRVIKIILQAVDMASDVLEKTQRGWKGLTGFLKKEWDETGASSRKLLGEFKNILNNSLVQGVGFAGLLAGLKKSWEASDTFEASLRKLEGTAKITGVPLETLEAIAARGKDGFGLSATMANDYAVELAKLATKAGDVGKATPGLEAFLDIGAARGLGAADTLKAVQQAILGIDEGTDKLFNANPSVLYKEYADSIGAAVGKLSDQQKAEAILTAALRDGEKVRGAYAEYLETAAGKQEALRIKTEEAMVALGQSTQSIRDLVVPALQWLADAAVAFIGGWQLLWVDAAIATEKLGPAMRGMAGSVLMTLSELIGESRIVLTLFGDSATDLADKMGNAGVRMKTSAEKDKRNLEQVREEMYAEIVGIATAGEKRITTITGTAIGDRQGQAEDGARKTTQIEKDRATELERINNDLAVKLVQYEKGLTEDQAKEFVRRRRLLTGETTTMVTDLETGYRKLDEFNVLLAAGFNKEVVPSVKSAKTEIGNLATAFKTEFPAATTVTKGTTDEIKDGLSPALQGAIGKVSDMGTEMGILSEEAGRAVGQAASLADELIRAQGNPLAMVGVIGGLAGMIGSALAGQSEAKRIMDANTRATEDNTRRIGDLMRFESSGYAMDSIASVLGGLDWKTLGKQYDASPGLADQVLRGQLMQGLRGFGLGMSDVTKLAEELGIEITDSKGRLIPGAVRQILGALGNVETTQYGQDWASQMDRIRSGVGIGAIAPENEFGEIMKLLTNLGVTGITDLFAGADVGSMEGRSAFAESLRGLFGSLNDGSIDRGLLGKLNGQQFVEAITLLISLLTDANETAAKAIEEAQKAAGKATVPPPPPPPNPVIAAATDEQEKLIKALLSEFGFSSDDRSAIGKALDAGLVTIAEADALIREIRKVVGDEDGLTAEEAESIVGPLREEYRNSLLGITPDIIEELAQVPASVADEIAEQLQDAGGGYLGGVAGGPATTAEAFLAGLAVLATLGTEHNLHLVSIRDTLATWMPTVSAAAGSTTVTIGDVNVNVPASVGSPTEVAVAVREQLVDVIDEALANRIRDERGYRGDARA